MNSFKNVREFLYCFEYVDDSESNYSKMFQFEPEMNLIRTIYKDNSYELDEMEYIERHTLFEIDALTHNARWFSVIACDLLNDTKIVNKGGKSSLEKLHFCPKCIQEDQDAGREPYFRTWHQHPVCKICAKHNVKLFETTEDMINGLDNGKLTVPSEFSDMPYESRLSEFLYKHYLHPFGIDLFLFAKVVNNRIVSMSGPYIEKNWAIEEGFKKYGTTLKGRSFTRTGELQLASLKGEDLFCISCFVFPFQELRSACIEQMEYVRKQFQAESDGELSIIASKGTILKVRCKKCGRIFIIYNQPFASGFMCPACRQITRDEAFQNIMLLSGSRQYDFIGVNSQGQFEQYKCRKCGDIHMRVKSIGKITPLSVLCACGKSMNIQTSQLMADPSMRKYVVEQITDTAVIIRHIGGCGRTFSLSLRNLHKGVACPCEKRTDFIQYCHEPDDYEAFEKDGQFYFKHKLCGTYTKLEARGKYNLKCLCKFCYSIPYKTKLIEMVLQSSGEETLEISPLNRKDYRLTFVDHTIILNKRQIINELISRDVSSVFPNKKRLMLEQSMKSKVYCAIRDHCQLHNGLWRECEGLEVDIEPDILKDILEKLVFHNYLEKKDGGYAIIPPPYALGLKGVKSVY